MAVGDEPLGSWRTTTIVRNMFPMLVVLSTIVLVAGLTLEGALELLASHAVLAVIVPPMIGMGGNLGAILSSRLTTRFHLGTTVLDPNDPMLWANVGAIFALGATIFSGLAVCAYLLGLAIGAPLPLATLLTISLLSGIGVAVIAVVFSFAATYAAYQLGIDPDDTTIPIVTNVVDVAGMVIFVAVSSVVLGG